MVQTRNQLKNDTEISDAADALIALSQDTNTGYPMRTRANRGHHTTEHDNHRTISLSFDGEIVKLHGRNKKVRR
jgi:hypothetical protein